MRRVALLLLTFLIPVALLGSLLVVQANQPPAWQLELDKYVEYRMLLAPEAIGAQFVDRAHRPWNFSRDMSAMAIGDSPYYQTDMSYSGEESGGGRKPLPYPPENVWCAYLESPDEALKESTVATAARLVFIAEHVDLYNASLVVHETVSDRSSQMDFLTRVGCNSLLEEVSR